MLETDQEDERERAYKYGHQSTSVDVYMQCLEQSSNRTGHNGKEREEKHITHSLKHFWNGQQASHAAKVLSSAGSVCLWSLAAA